MEQTMQARRRQSWFWAGEEPEWLVVATALVALLLGALLMLIVTTRTVPFEAEGIRFRYPAGWLQGQDEETFFRATEFGSPAALQAEVLAELTPEAPVSLEQLGAQRTFTLANTLGDFRVLSSQVTMVNGTPAIQLDYAYVDSGLRSAYQSGLPVVMQGRDIIVPMNGLAYVFSLTTDADEFARDERVLTRLVQSIRAR